MHSFFFSSPAPPFLPPLIFSQGEHFEIVHWKLPSVRERLLPRGTRRPYQTQKMLSVTSASFEFLGVGLRGIGSRGLTRQQVRTRSSFAHDPPLPHPQLSALFYPYLPGGVLQQCGPDLVCTVVLIPGYLFEHRYLICYLWQMYLNKGIASSYLWHNFFCKSSVLLCLLQV